MIGQLAIGPFGVAAVFLSQDPREQRRRWASVFALAASWISAADEGLQEGWGLLDGRLHKAMWDDA